MDEQKRILWLFTFLPKVCQGVFLLLEFFFYPPTQKAMVLEAVHECVEGTLRSSYERSGVCFGGFRPTKHVEEPRASARGGSTSDFLITRIGSDVRWNWKRDR